MSIMIEKQIGNYIQSLGGTPTVEDRVLHLLKGAKRVMSDPKLGLQDGEILICDRLDAAGKRHLVNFWLISHMIAVEWHDFMSRENFDVIVIRDAIWNIEWTSDHYDLSQGRPSGEGVSKLQAEAVGVERVNLVFFASGNNCERLDRIVQAYLVPNLSAPTATPLE